MKPLSANEEKDILMKINEKDENMFFGTISCHDSVICFVLNSNSLTPTQLLFGD